MKPEQISRPEWFSRPVVQGVCDAFERAGRPLRFVGGAVRDHLLGWPVHDIDAATTATPDETLALLAQHRIKAVPTGIAHGTITAVVGGETLEITTLRRDVATDGRHAVVAFTDDWQQDAARRDFTINALYLSPQGMLYDEVGGRKDLQEGIIRFIGKPEARIAEDHLRILRYFRFLATHGRQSPDVASLAACENAAQELLNLSGERIRQEMMKLLAAPHPQMALEAMQACGVLPAVTGSAFGLATLTPLYALEMALSLPPHPLVRLGVLLRSTGGGMALARAISERWKCSSREKKLLEAFIRHQPASTLDARHCRQLLYHYGSEIGPLILLVDAAERGVEAAAFAPVWEEAQGWIPPRLPVSGEDIKAAGLSSGPALGKALRALEDAWIASDFTLNHAALLKLLP